jgi:squalene-hopene cyclase-like protein
VPNIRQIAAVAVVSGVAVASLAAPSTAAITKTPSTSSRGAAAAGYLARQLTGKHHDHYVLVAGKKSYPQYGETADGVLSMDAAGVAQIAAAKATKWLEKTAKHYVVAHPTDNPGPAGKLLLVAEAQHIDPTKFGHVNLIKAIVNSEGAGGAAVGEYQQNPTGSSTTAYVVDQALPVLALANVTTTGAQPDAAAVAFLAGQQCSNGGFQTNIRNNTATPCKHQDADDTGYAVQALIAAGDHAAAQKGLNYLLKTQHSNGAFGKPANANSTALALQALIDGHEVTAGPLAWLVKHQVGCSSAAAHRGAVAYKKKYNGSALFATSQAGAALALKPLAWIDKTGANSAAPVLYCKK